jgi:DNA-binding MarR family transcriptional regulator
MGKATKSAADRAATDLLMAASLLVRRLRLEASSQELISWTQVAVMHRLESGPLTIADLARSESIKPQSMGGSVAALEERGFVERRPDPDDGRQFFFALTPAGQEVRRVTSNAKQAWLAKAIGELEAEDREVLFASIDVLRKLSEK